MFAGMPDVHDLHGSGKVFGHQPPDPGGSIPQDHQLVRPLQPILDSQGIEQRALVFRFRATSHIVLVPCLIHKHAWRQSRTFWPAGGLKDRADFDFPIHIPLAFAFLLLHRDTASPQPGEHSIQFDGEPINGVWWTCRVHQTACSCLKGLLPQRTDLLIFLLLQGFA